MKKSWEEQKHLIRQPTDKVAKRAKKTKQLVVGNLCALAPLREIVYFFTASDARATPFPFGKKARRYRQAERKDKS